MRENQPHTRVVEPVCVAPLSGQAVFVTQHGFILFYFAAFAHPFLSIMLSIQQVKIFNFYLLGAGMKMYLDFIHIVLLLRKITCAASLMCLSVDQQWGC